MSEKRKCTIGGKNTHTINPKGFICEPLSKCCLIIRRKMLEKPGQRGYSKGRSNA